MAQPEPGLTALMRDSLFASIKPLADYLLVPGYYGLRWNQGCDAPNVPAVRVNGYRLLNKHSGRCLGELCPVDGFVWPHFGMQADAGDPAIVFRPEHNPGNDIRSMRSGIVFASECIRLHVPRLMDGMYTDRHRKFCYSEPSLIDRLREYVAPLGITFDDV